MITFYLFCTAIAWFVTCHRESKMWHNWLYYRAFEKSTDDDLKEFWKVKNYWLYCLYQLITCAFCVGFWTACFYTIFMYESNFSLIVFWLIIKNSFIAGLLSVIVCSLYQSIER